MEGTALLGRLNWLVADVVDLVAETPRVKTITFSVPTWRGHRAGQHVDVRLTAEDGYQAERSYSIASAPNGTRIELTVERLDDGEVSPYLTDEMRAGDQIELRGPIGGYFVWEPSQSDPLFLVAGGSGGVPLMAMLRHRAAAGNDAEARLLFSSRTWDDIIYRHELEQLNGQALTVVHTLTRSQPPRWSGYSRRVDAEMLANVGPGPQERPLVYVCGPTPFVEAVATALVQLGQSHIGSRPSASDRREAEMDALMVDGNAIAGLLQEVFAVEMTTALGTCGNCGAAEAGAIHVYRGAGIVLCCPHCNNVLAKIVKNEALVWIALPGARTLELSL